MRYVHGQMVLACGLDPSFGQLLESSSGSEEDMPLQKSRGLCLRGGSTYFIPADASVQDCREAIAPSSRFPGGLYVVANTVYLRV